MNDLEQFSLRWNNFHRNLSAGFCALLQEDALVDVTLAADGRFLQAHRLVLSVCSPYFKQLFAANPCKHPIVILKDVHHKQLSDLLNFMYQGEVNVRQEELATFLRTAELLQIKGLTGEESESDSSAQQGLDPHPVLREEPYVHIHEPSPSPRQRFNRRTRPQDKHAAAQPRIAPSVDLSASPTPSPPPSKRQRPSTSSPVVNAEEVREEDSKRNESEKTARMLQVKSEPVSDFPLDSVGLSQIQEQACEAGGSTADPPVNTTSSQNEKTDQSALAHQNSGSDDRHKGNPRPQPSTSEGNSAAGSSNFPLPFLGADGSTLGPTENEQGSLVPQYVHSRKGGLQLVLDGFLYTVHQQQGRNKYWRCVERGKLGCQGYCKTFMQDEGEVVRTLRLHNHGRQDDKIRERVNATRLRLQILHALSQRQIGTTVQNPGS